MASKNKGHESEPGGVESDKDLIRLSSRGDREAFGRLVKRYQDRVYNLAFRLTGQHHAALDLSQDAFVRAFAAMPRFRGESGFFTWIYRIAMNLHMNTERSLAGRARKKTFSLNPVPVRGEESRSLDLEEPRETDPAKPLEDRERDRIIHEALLKLDVDYRRVVLLRDLEGQSYEDIAAILEIPIGTVKSRLHRAREELKTKLKGVV
jgi:RNA polymerase sigma-70 factor (ECF subfamily)